MIIDLGVFGIKVEVDSGAGSISSDLHEEVTSKGDKLFNAAMDGIESMILAHACAGIDIQSPEYIEGIETAVQSCGNQF